MRLFITYFRNEQLVFDILNSGAQVVILCVYISVIGEKSLEIFARQTTHVIARTVNLLLQKCNIFV